MDEENTNGNEKTKFYKSQINRLEMLRKEQKEKIRNFEEILENEEDQEELQKKRNRIQKRQTLLFNKEIFEDSFNSDLDGSLNLSGLSEIDDSDLSEEFVESLNNPSKIKKNNESRMNFTLSSKYANGDEIITILPTTTEFIQAPANYKEKGYNINGKFSTDLESPRRIFTKRATKKKKMKQPKLTIPEPFSFQFRNKPESSIVSRNLENYLKEKNQKDKELNNYKFKAKRIPWTSKTKGLWKEIEENTKLKKQERKEKRKQWLKDKEKPFSFMKDTKKYVLNKEKRMKELENKLRKEKDKEIGFNELYITKEIPLKSQKKYSKVFQNIQLKKEKEKIEARIDRAKEMLQNSKFPSSAIKENMEKRKEKRKENEEIRKRNEYFQKFAHKKVPNFMILQTEFEEILKNNKKNQKLTKIQEFKLSKGKEKEKIKKEIMNDIDNDNKKLNELRWPYLTKRKKPKRIEITELNLITKKDIEGEKEEHKNTYAQELREMKIKERILKEKIKNEQKMIEKMRFGKPKINKISRRIIERKNLNLNNASKGIPIKKSRNKIKIIKRKLQESNEKYDDEMDNDSDYLGVDEVEEEEVEEYLDDNSEDDISSERNEEFNQSLNSSTLGEIIIDPKQ